MSKPVKMTLSKAFPRPKGLDSAGLGFCSYCKDNVEVFFHKIHSGDWSEKVKRRYLRGMLGQSSWLHLICAACVKRARQDAQRYARNRLSKWRYRLHASVSS